MFIGDLTLLWQGRWLILRIEWLCLVIYCTCLLLKCELSCKIEGILLWCVICYCLEKRGMTIRSSWLVLKHKVGYLLLVIRFHIWKNARITLLLWNQSWTELLLQWRWILRGDLFACLEARGQVRSSRLLHVLSTLLIFFFNLTAALLLSFVHELVWHACLRLLHITLRT